MHELHDAAEHLPTVLKQATTEGLTLTAALERLPAIEVDATEARRLAGRLRFTCLPTPARLENFDSDTAPAAINRILHQSVILKLDGDSLPPARPPSPHRHAPTSRGSQRRTSNLTPTPVPMTEGCPVVRYPDDGSTKYIGAR
ncbi:hypothetical protein Kisp01_70910 [Kineosporia sp. NBRC 101677]|nr:hypothetical protein [Kineosporia sp. NBRC 101677]GLY20077.1 hypothetical protein Kisp01_70910 [Kineosporia sp. NBRC 101677]